MIARQSGEKISVIIPCYNEYKYIGHCIDSLLNNEFPSELLEIIVVDGMSNDGTREVINEFIEKHNNIVLLDNPKRITPIALNTGISHAQGDYILIASAHASFSNNYIATLLNRLKKLKATGVGGKIITKTKAKTNTARAIVKVLSDFSGVGNSTFRTGADEPVLVDTVPFGLYRKSVYDKYGFYNEALTRNHDIEWSKRMMNAGGKVYLIPETYSNYYAREALKDLALNNFQNGYWNIITFYLTKKLWSLSLRHYIPFFFVGIQLLLILTGIFVSKYCWYFLLATIAIYGVYVVVNSLVLKDKITGFFNLILVFIVLHYSYGFGSIIGMFNFSKLLHR